MLTTSTMLVLLGSLMLISVNGVFRNERSQKQAATGNVHHADFDDSVDHNKLDDVPATDGTTDDVPENGGTTEKMQPSEKSLAEAKDRLVSKKLRDLKNMGCKAKLSLADISMIDQPCHLKGALTYKDLVLHFDMHDGGSIFEKPDRTVMFAREAKSEDGVAVTVEGTSFVTQSNAASGMIHVGSHQDHFHNTSGASISHALLSASPEKYEFSANLFREKMEELYDDAYDNTVLELVNCFMAEGISGKSHSCSWELYNIYVDLSKKSRVIDSSVAEEMSMVRVTDTEVEAVASSLERGESEEEWGIANVVVSGISRAIQEIPPRRRHRHPYNKCGNAHFGRIGDAFGFLGCLLYPCWDCNCNAGSEGHDDLCHCDTTHGEHCAGTALFLDRWGGCSPCASDCASSSGGSGTCCANFRRRTYDRRRGC